MVNNLGKGLEYTGMDKKTKRPQFVARTEKNEDTLISDLIGDSPTGKLWSYLWETRDLMFDMKDMIDGSGNSRSAIYIVLPRFIKNEWVIPFKIEKRTQLYKLNKNHYIVKQMLRLLDDHANAAFELISAEEQARDRIALKHRKNDKELLKSLMLTDSKKDKKVSRDIQKQVKELKKQLEEE